MLTCAGLLPLGPASTTTATSGLILQRAQQDATGSKSLIFWRKSWYPFKTICLLSGILTPCRTQNQKWPSRSPPLPLVIGTPRSNAILRPHPYWNWHPALPFTGLKDRGAGPWNILDPHGSWRRGPRPKAWPILLNQGLGEINILPEGGKSREKMPPTPPLQPEFHCKDVSLWWRKIKIDGLGWRVAL